MQARKKPPPVTLFDLDQIHEAARADVSPAYRQRTPLYGRLGLCIACKLPALAHFDAVGGWLGCPAASDDTVFILFPVASGAVRTEATPPKRSREFQVARYTPVIPAPLLKSPLSDQRKQVLALVIEAGEAGLRAQEVVAKLGIPAGSVQQALAWLRLRGLVAAHEGAITAGSRE